VVHLSIVTNVTGRDIPLQEICIKINKNYVTIFKAAMDMVHGRCYNRIDGSGTINTRQ